MIEIKAEINSIIDCFIVVVDECLTYEKVNMNLVALAFDFLLIGLFVSVYILVLKKQGKAYAFFRKHSRLLTLFLFSLPLVLLTCSFSIISNIKSLM